MGASADMKDIKEGNKRTDLNTKYQLRKLATVKKQVDAKTYLRMFRHCGGTCHSGVRGDLRKRPTGVPDLQVALQYLCMPG